MRFGTYFLPAAIIILGLVLRAYNLEGLADFGFDQEVAAFWVKKLLVDHKFSLVGQEISVGGVFIGPFYYYLLAPFYFLTRLYPLGGNVLAVLTATLAMITLWRLAKKAFNYPVAVISLFLYAIHPGIIAFDRTVAPSNVIILLSTTAAYLLVKNRRSWLDILVLGVILGLTVSVHPTAVLLIPITLLLLRSEERYWVLPPVLLLISPLILFDLRHQGLIIHNTFSVVSSGRNNIFSIVELFLTYWAGIIVSNDLVWIKFPLFLLAVWVFWCTKGRLLKPWLLVPLVAMIFYSRHVPEYYFLLITPIVLVYTVGFLAQGRKLILLAVIVLLAVLNIRLPKNDLSLYYKDRVARYIAAQAAGQPVTVYYSTDPGQGSGFNYLFWLRGVNLATGVATKFLVIVPSSRERSTVGEEFGDIKVARLPN